MCVVDDNDSNLRVDLQRRFVEVPLLTRPQGIWLDNIITDHPSYAAAAASCFQHRVLKLEDGNAAVIIQVPLR